MKEIGLKPEQAEVRDITEEQREYMKFLGQKRLQRGQKFFRIKLDGGEMEEVVIESNRLVMHKNYFYVSALNKNNAMRKYLKLIKMMMERKTAQNDTDTGKNTSNARNGSGLAVSGSKLPQNLI